MQHSLQQHLLLAPTPFPLALLAIIMAAPARIRIYGVRVSFVLAHVYGVSVCACVCVCNERCLLFSTSDPREWTLGIFLCKCSTPNASGQHSPQRSAHCPPARPFTSSIFHLWSAVNCGLLSKWVFCGCRMPEH